MNEIERLYSKTREKHLKTLRRILNGDSSSAEDIFQNAIVRAMEYFSSFDPTRGKIENWFSGIVFNELARFMKKEEGHESLDKWRWIEDGVDYTTLIENFIYIDDHIKLLRSNKNREILRLVYQLGYSMKDTADLLGTTETNVRQLCFRFRGVLKDD